MTDRRIRARFHHGVFEPQAACDLAEGSEVDLSIESARDHAATVQDPAERAHLRRALVERIRDRPFPASAHRWSRDELHGRR